MKITILSLVVFFGIKLLQLDSTAVNGGMDNARVASSSSDTLQVAITRTPSSSWIERNEGAIIGAFVGVIIALLGVFLTSLSQRRNEYTRLNKLRRGYLFALREELDTHKRLIQFVREVFEAIMKRSIEIKQIVIDKPPRTLPVSFLTELRTKLLESRVYDDQIFRLLTAYINQCELINADIDLTEVRKVVERQPATTDVVEALKGYSNTLNKQIEILQTANKALLETLATELDKSK